MKAHNLIERAMIEWRIVVTLVAGLVIFGTISFLSMPRQEFPDFTVRQGLVVGIMPGATSAEVEERLAKPVEDFLFSFEEVNKLKTYSLSKEGQLIVFVELNDRVAGLAADAFWAKLRLGLTELREQSLPPQVVALVGNNDFGDTSALLLTLTSEGHSARDLQSQLEVVEAQLRRLPGTSKLRRFGMQREVIRVTLSSERLSHYGVRPATVWLALQGTASQPAPARLDTKTLELPVHVGAVLRSEDKLAQTIVFTSPTGSHVRLADVANIRREYGHDDAFVRFDGKQAVVLSVEMQKGHNITTFGREVNEALTEARRELPSTVRIARVVDQPQVVAVAVGHFVRDFGLAIAAVIAMTMLLLPLRVAMVAAVSIPISILITLGVLNALGVQLQTVSLAGLIVVLGMVVDNAIVIIDDHVERLDHGVDVWTAARESATSLAGPVFSATLAIIMAYVPLAWFLKGMGGEFVGSLPVTIAVALGASLLVAVFLLPILNVRFIRHGLHRADGDERASVLDRVRAVYGRSLELAFHRPRLAIGAGVASVLAAALLGFFMPQQLFPKVDRNQFAVEIYLPSGRPLARTDDVARRVERELLRDPRVTHVTSFIGTSSPRFHTTYIPNLPSRNFAQLLVSTVSDEATVEVLHEYEQRHRNGFPEGWVRWKQLDLQATSAPIEVRLSGSDIPQLRQLALRLEAAARAIPGVTWIRNDFGEPLQGVNVLPDADKAARLGVTSATLQASLTAGSSLGLPIATLWEHADPIPVILGVDPRVAQTMQGFRQQYVSSLLLGAVVPVEEVVRIQPDWNEEAIVHRNGVRTLTVRVDVGPGTLASDVERKLDRAIEAMGPTPGIRIGWGGEREGTVENYTPMSISMAASVAIIYLILLFEFGRHRLVLLVMVTMPLALFGAVLGLMLTGNAFGFTSFLGVISLMGIVVRNGIILVGYAEELRAQGMSSRDAALAAGMRRMRPIVLTSAAAAVGVVPMILSGSTLWGPLGAVTFFGLIFSTLLTLIVLPVAYWLMARSVPVRHASAAAVSGVLLLVSLCALPTTAGAQSGTLTLDQVRRLAARSAPKVRQALEETTAAVQTRRAAFTNFFPSVSSAAVAVAARTPLVDVNIPGGNLPVNDASGASTGNVTDFRRVSMALADRVRVLSLTAVQPLYVGGRVVNGNRLAALGVAVAEDKAALARRDAVAQAEEKYWRLVTLGQKGQTLRAYKALLTDLERQASDAVAAGLVTSNDLLKVRLKLQEADVDRLRLESGRRLATRDLRLHLGLSESAPTEVTDTVQEPAADDASLGNSGSDLTVRRPELRLLRLAVRAEALKTAMAIGNALPAVSVGAQLLRYDLGGLGTRGDALVFATVSVPLSGAWKTAHEVRGLQARERMAALQLSEARELVALEISKRHDDLMTAWLASRVADLGVQQATVNLKEASDRSAGGLATLSDLLEAQVLHRQALDRQTDARVDYWLARSAFLRAMGADELPAAEAR
ncbi:MAG: efflux RND transporter permease subunit [Acidobacteria bacterium]|nr:efflux RND transporter permease subunit [Acidobacteriota bacterium]